MGCKELIESLRAAGEGKVRELQAEAEREAEHIRAEAASRIAALREGHARERRAAEARQSEVILAGASSEVRRIRIRSERALADRLESLARTSLHTLRNVGYGDVFASFVRELPRLDWKAVRVNPSDIALAKEHFPDAAVAPDPAISGGFEVRSENDRISVVNTFEKRLERRWEEMLPEIMRSVQENCR
jgi:vacuolar-type H+-ATPase subunit E/Vma4